nr:bHLH42-1 protein [Tulipa gesneriana]
MAAPQSSRLQQLLQSVVQSVQWTYSLFWHLCPQQGILVWREGYYNGAIKTRKTVQATEVSAEEATLHRSQQLLELYESLSAGEAGQAAPRPCAALSPEDLTESEWFYLMCISFTFPPGFGLPGKAYTKGRHVWLTRANEAESKVFSRAILAKGAHIQTVVCIPLLDGVLELGTTEKVEEDLGLIQHATSLFADYLENQPNPALSEHSTSNPMDYAQQSLFNTQPSATIEPMYMHPHEPNQEENDGDDDDDTEEEDSDDNEDELEVGPDSEMQAVGYNAGLPAQPIHPSLATADAEIPAIDSRELMQIEISEGIRLGSPDNYSNNLDLDLPMFAMDPSGSNQSEQRDDPYQAWHFQHEDLCNRFPQSSDATKIQDLSAEDAHYSGTISSILSHNSSGWSNSGSICYLAHSQQSAFHNWNSGDQIQPMLSGGTSQWVLKYILFSVPNLHSKNKDDDSPESRDGDGCRFRKGTSQEDPSANHVLAERRRREKLNERFIILRSLVPFVTKMDKASILGDTIEYVKQLRRRIQDLESQIRQMESNQRSKETAFQRPSNSKDQTVQIYGNPNAVQQAYSCRDKVAFSGNKKLSVVNEGKGAAKDVKAVEASSTNVQVSIIESDALLELQCVYRDGLLLKIMQSLDGLQLEVKSVQSSSTNSTFSAEIRAKVKEVQGKKTSIGKVKKAMQHILSQYSLC